MYIFFLVYMAQIVFVTVQGLVRAHRPPRFRDTPPSLQPCAPCVHPGFRPDVQSRSICEEGCTW